MSSFLNTNETPRNNDLLPVSNLLPAIYNDLRRLANSKMAREKPGQTLSATALLHEALLRLIRNGDREYWESEGHLFAAVAETMRRILIDIARQKQSKKRGGGFNRVNEENFGLKIEANDSDWMDDLLELDEALIELEAERPRAAELVKLRYFCDMNLVKAAKVMGVCEKTASRYWKFAKAWLALRIDRS